MNFLTALLFLASEDSKLEPQGISVVLKGARAIAWGHIFQGHNSYF